MVQFILQLSVLDLKSCIAVLEGEYYLYYI